MAAVKGHDVIIHAAAQTTSSRSGRDVQYRINVVGTRNVARACNQVGAKLLHVSSVAAVGISPNPERPANEEFEFNLDDSGMEYHVSKHCAEEAVMKESDDGLEAVIVNPAPIWGRGYERYRGANTLTRPLNNCILPHGPGGQCIVHVSDVVDGIVLALELGRAREKYILAGDNVSFCELNRTICRQL